MRSAAARVQSSSTPIDRGAARLDLRRQPRLDGGVVLQRAVAVEMVFGHVEQDADGRRAAKARDRSGRRRLRAHRRGSAANGSSASTGTPILPPICASRPALVSRCAVSAVVVDLPLVPVMATSGQRAPDLARSRQNNSMSPMISTPALRASATRPMRLRMRERHARRQHQRGDASTSRVRADSACSARRLCASATLFSLSSKATTSAPPSISALRRQQPGFAEAEDRDLLAGKVVTGSGIIAASASPARRAPAPRRRSRSGSRSAARSSRAARSDGGSAPS